MANHRRFQHDIQVGGQKQWSLEQAADGAILVLHQQRHCQRDPPY
jgi:hypothetical protein